jgi:hypothetical protein
MAAARSVPEPPPSLPALRMRALIVSALLAAVSAVGGCGTASSRSSSRHVAARSPCATATRPPATYHHVVWIVMENQAYSSIVGSPKAPYINWLRSRCASATRFFAERHPSLPNYIAMTSGSTHAITDDLGPSAHRLQGRSIFSQVGASGWRALQESMPSPCRLGDAGAYAVRHDPATYYTGLRAACRSRDVALRAAADVSARFTFVSPNLCHDMHDCSVGVGDSWLGRVLPRIFAGSTYRAGRTAIFLTWDEDDRSASNHIATLVIAPSVRAGATSATRFDHYSMLRTTEQLLGLGYLGAASRASSMRRAFSL